MSQIIYRVVVLPHLVTVRRQRCGDHLSSPTLPPDSVYVPQPNLLGDRLRQAPDNPKEVDRDVVSANHRPHYIESVSRYSFPFATFTY